MYQFMYEAQMINYEIHRKSVKYINIRIKSSRVVYVSAPKKVSQQTIESILLKKGEWILKSLQNFSEKEKDMAREMNWADGDLVMYLGKPYKLIIKEASQDQVELNENSIILQLRAADQVEKRKQLYENWLRKQSTFIFQSIMEEQLEPLKEVIKEKPLLKVRRMKARWGTCFSTKNIIQLNLELIKKPRAAIEYVILHELAHFIHPNHSKAFYDFIATIMPDWKERKNLLKH